MPKQKVKMRPAEVQEYLTFLERHVQQLEGVVRALNNTPVKHLSGKYGYRLTATPDQHQLIQEVKGNE